MVLAPLALLSPALKGRARLTKPAARADAPPLAPFRG